MKTLFVTGASRGIGRHLAQRATEEGFRAIGLARQPGDDLPFEMRALDVTDADEVTKLFAEFRRDDTVYGLINGAGVAAMNLVVTTPVATLRRIVETNLLGTVYCCQAMGRLLARRRRGRIVNISTIAVPLAIEGEAVYAASKAGVETFSRVFAREMADYGVTVNCLAPGPVDTRLIAGVPHDKIQAIVARQIIPRQATPEDLWATVSVLLRPESAMITGETIHIGGV